MKLKFWKNSIRLFLNFVSRIFGEYVKLVFNYKIQCICIIHKTDVNDTAVKLIHAMHGRKANSCYSWKNDPSLICMYAHATTSGAIHSIARTCL